VYGARFGDQRAIQSRERPCPHTSRAKLALVFANERGTPFSGWSKAKSALDIASGVSGWWLHDLRRTLNHLSGAGLA
jgi:hypothetical protein